MTVSGEWAESEYFPPERADEVIVIGDVAGAALLVVPQLGADVPEVDENSVLRVTGTVRIPARGDAGYLDVGGVLAIGDGPAPVVAAERVEPAGVFVSVPRSERDRIEDGERATIRAELARLSSYGADAIEKAIRSDPRSDQPRSELDLQQIPIEVGRPHLLFRGLPG